MTIETIPETAVPLEPTTPIRPSEAIRLGCLTTVQVFGISGEGPEACALTAAEVGGFRGGFSSMPKVTCPVANCRDISGFVGGSDRAHYVVIHLNDDHRWSRERIADWLEGLGL